MHPTLARFLSFDAAKETLAREARQQPLDAEEQAFVQVARREPERRTELLKAASARSSSVQQSLLFLAAHAAVLALRQDEATAPLAEAARDALLQRGNSADSADGALAAL